MAVGEIFNLSLRSGVSPARHGDGRTSQQSVQKLLKTFITGFLSLVQNVLRTHPIIFVDTIALL